MCGRFALKAPATEIERFFKVNAPVPIPDRYNIAPRQPVLIIRHTEKAVRELAAVEWGLVPEWKKEIGDKPLINARVETIEAKPSFRSSIKRKRCLVPFTGWYEWKTVDGLKVPHFISHMDGEMHAFAGIWSTWHGPHGDHWLETMSIVTAASSGIMRGMHHRKPLVVKPEQFEDWLTLHDPLPRNFLGSFDWEEEQHFHWRPVSRKVNSVRYDGPDCLDPPEENPQGVLF